MQGRRFAGTGLTGRRRWLLVALVLALVLAPSLTFAQSTEQRRSRPVLFPPEAIPRLDLAAMTLTTDDLAAAGLVDYGIGSGRARSLRQTAEVYADNRGDKSRPAIDREAAFLESAGWQRGYESGLATLSQEDPGYFATVVTSSIDVYTTTAGARQSFQRYSDPSEVTVVTVELLPNPEPLGDERKVWLAQGEATDTGEPFQAVLAMFQQGNMEGGVGLYNWNGEAPDPALAQALAATLLARVTDATAPATPPLSTTALSFGDTGIDSFYHNYLFRDDVVIPFAGDPPEALDQRRADYGTASEVYNVNQYFPAGGPGEEDDGRYALWRYHFSDEATAQAWFDDELAQFSGFLAPLAIGDQAYVYSYLLPPDAPPVTRGYVGYLLVGTEVAVIDLRAAPEVPLVSFSDVMQLQARCMDASAPCALADIPWHLRNTMVPEPEATPATAGAAPAPNATPTSDDAAPAATPVGDEDGPMATPTGGAGAPDGTPVSDDLLPTPAATPAA